MRPAWRHVVALVAAIAATVPATIDRTGGTIDRHVHAAHSLLADLSSLQEVRDVQNRIRASYATADPSGRRGAGGRGVAHSRDRLASGAFAPSAQLFRTGYISIEPTLGIHPDGSLFINATNVPPTDDFTYDGITIRSQDQGASWQDVSPTLAGVPTHPHTLDPYLYLDEATGRLFMSDLSTTEVCQRVSFTDDVGATWTESVLPCGEVDHQNLFAGRPVYSSTLGYPNVVYNCAVNAVVGSHQSTMTTCLKSLDGGLSFVPTGAPPFSDDPSQMGPGMWNVPGNCSGVTGHGFVDTIGAVYVPRGWCDQPWLAISSDEGRTWTRIQVAEAGVSRDEWGNPEHEAAVAAAGDTIYYFWVARDRIPYLVVSRDAGQSWSDPVRVAPPDVTEASMPAMSMGADGRLAFAYMGSTNSPGVAGRADSACIQGLEDPVGSIYRGVVPGACPEAEANLADTATTWNGYITVSADAAAANPAFYTVPANDPADPFIRGTCGPTRCKAVYDFIDVQIALDGTPWAVFVDACVPGQACTRIGEGVVAHMTGGPPLR